MNWQPIKTAPENKAVLVWNDDYLTIAMKNTHIGEWVDFGDHPMFDGTDLTHWMPLPSPPSVEDGERE